MSEKESLISAPICECDAPRCEREGCQDKPTKRVRMDLSHGHIDVNVSPDASPETMAALRNLGEAALAHMVSDSFVFATADQGLFEGRYHVPRSQVWEGSRGRQRGAVHLHVREQFDLGRIHRKPGRALCGRIGWYERLLDQDEVASPCRRCAEIARRLL